jgi:hypothetical protein
VRETTDEKALPYSHLFLDIDTREQDESRVKAITKYFEERGGTVRRCTCYDCDYVVYGTFRRKKVDVGLEFKGLGDLTSTWRILPERLYRAVNSYSTVALFIHGKVDITENAGKVYVENKGTVDDTGEVMLYTTYQSKVWQWCIESHIHVWQFDRLTMFGESLNNLLFYVTSAPHPLLVPPKGDVDAERFNSYCQIPGIAAGTASQMKYHGVDYWLKNRDELLKLVKPSKYQRLMKHWGAIDDECSR